MSAAADAGVLVTPPAHVDGGASDGPALVLAFACLTPDLLGEALTRVVGGAEALSRPPDPGVNDRPRTPATRASVPPGERPSS